MFTKLFLQHPNQTKWISSPSFRNHSHPSEFQKEEFSSFFDDTHVAAQIEVWVCSFSVWLWGVTCMLSVQNLVKRKVSTFQSVIGYPSWQDCTILPNPCLLINWVLSCGIPILLHVSKVNSCWIGIACFVSQDMCPLCHFLCLIVDPVSVSGTCLYP